MQIAVNDKDWNGLSQQEQEKIREIITQIFKEQHQIAPDAQASSAPQASAAAPQVGSICTIGCDIVQKAAEVACHALPNPIAQQVCLIAAQKAGDFCRSKC